MIGENLKAEKALITRSNLQWNGVNSGCQLWQEVKTSRLERPAPIFFEFVDKNMRLFCLDFPQYGEAILSEKQHKPAFQPTTTDFISVTFP